MVNAKTRIIKELLNHMLNEPKYGDIAICKRGYIGLVLETDEDICYGINLSRIKLGSKWQSESPEIIGNIYEYIQSCAAKAGQI